MAEYLHPDVYIEEIERGPKPIEGVSTSTAALLGRTERGPTQPQFVTSFNRYKQLFGSVFEHGQYMPHAVAAFFDHGGVRCYVCRIVGKGASAGAHQSGDIKLTASGPGKWSERVRVKIGPSTTMTVDADHNPKPIGIKLDIAYWQVKPEDEDIDPFDPSDPRDPSKPPPVAPNQIEHFDDVVLDDPRSPNYYTKRIGTSSGLIRFEVTAKLAPGEKMELPQSAELFWLDPGEDGDDPGPSDYAGDNDDGADKNDPQKRQGLKALLLDQYRDIALVYAPNVEPAIGKLIVSHCERQRFRFAVVDAVSGKNDPTSLDPRTEVLDSSFGAYYYPWIKISDPATGAPLLIPPGGAVLGIYARSDNQRGVFKAPANEVVNAAIDLEYYIDNGVQDLLNPRGVNAIRQFPGRGIRVWGARTLSSDALWKYVSVRRLFIFLEHSIFDGTQWVVFEPNDERLWARVKDSIRVFLRGQWRDGALMGDTEAEAFTIACDHSTMTDDDVLNGRLICEIGIAPVRPAEFVIFKIFQITVEAKT
jgi:phage tail sheath protein FI